MFYFKDFPSNMFLMSLKHLYMGFLGGSVVEDPPVNAETEVQFLSWEDPLEEETATHSSILAWKITWTEEPGRLQSMGSQRARHN